MVVSDLSISFGGIKAVENLSFGVFKGEIFSIIGPNGAGKTTVLNCINGFYKPEKGKIIFNGKNLVGLPPHKIAQLGIGRTFQGIEVYPQLTTIDNIVAGRHVRMGQNPFFSAFMVGSAKKEEVKSREIAEKIIDFLDLHFYRKFPAGALPIGVQKRIALGRALAMEPKLLLLDEPMAGMSTEEKEDMARYIIEINREFGITIILVEHDMAVVKDLSNRIMVMYYGKKIAEGKTEKVINAPHVIRAYIGST